MASSFRFVRTLSNPAVHGQLHVSRLVAPTVVRFHFEHEVTGQSSPPRNFAIEVDLGADRRITFLEGTPCGLSWSPASRVWSPVDNSILPIAVGGPEGLRPHLDPNPTLLLNEFEDNQNPITARYIRMYFPYLEMYFTANLVIGFACEVKPKYGFTLHGDVTS